MTHRFASYNGYSKLADMVEADPRLLGVLERLDIRLGFGDASVAEVCERYNLSTELFLMICNVYSNDDYIPHIDNLTPSDLPHLVAYLRASHRYYTEVCFPRLHENIHRLVRSLDLTNHRVIDRFYDDYQSEVDKHFAYEEEVVFPYIESLSSNTQTDAVYSIDNFEHNHSNIEETLRDIKNIVLKYLPESCESVVRYEVLNDIIRIESDIERHTEIENRILIPLVAKFEKSDE